MMKRIRIATLAAVCSIQLKGCSASFHKVEGEVYDCGDTEVVLPAGVCHAHARLKKLIGCPGTKVLVPDSVELTSGHSPMTGPWAIDFCCNSAEGSTICVNAFPEFGGYVVTRVNPEHPTFGPKKMWHVCGTIDGGLDYCVRTSVEIKRPAKCSDAQADNEDPFLLCPHQVPVPLEPQFIR